MLMTNGIYIFPHVVIAHVFIVILKMGVFVKIFNQKDMIRNNVTILKLIVLLDIILNKMSVLPAILHVSLVMVNWKQLVYLVMKIYFFTKINVLNNVQKIQFNLVNNAYHTALIVIMNFNNHVINVIAVVNYVVVH